MSKEVSIVFIEEKKGLFKLGQEKKVAYGYAFNYLLPNNLAILNSKENTTQINALKKKTIIHQEKLKVEAKKVHETLNNQSIKLTAKSHDEGKLYGSISINDVTSAINRQYETTIDKHDFIDFTPIKEIGTFQVTVSIHKEYSTKVDIIVEKEIEKEIKSATAKKAAKKSQSSVQTYADEIDEPKKEKNKTTKQDTATQEIADDIF